MFWGHPDGMQRPGIHRWPVGSWGLTRGSSWRQVASRWPPCGVLRTFRQHEALQFNILLHTSKKIDDYQVIPRKIRQITVCIISSHHLMIFYEFSLKKSSCFLRRPQKLMKSSPSIWHYLVKVKSMVKISSFFVAFLENTNFNTYENLTSISYLVTTLKALLY